MQLVEAYDSRNYVQSDVEDSLSPPLPRLELRKPEETVEVKLCCKPLPLLPDGVDADSAALLGLG